MAPLALTRVEWSSLGGIALSCVLASGALYAGYFYFLGRSYEEGDLSTAYPIIRGSGTCGAAILSLVLLGEEVSLFGIAGIAVVCLAILSLSFVGLRTGDLRASYRSALLCGVTIALYVNVDNLAVDHINPVAYTFFCHVVALILLMKPVVLERRDDFRRVVREQWREALAIGFGSIGTYLMILYAYKYAPLSYIVAVRESSIVFAALYGVVLLRESLSLQRIGTLAGIVAGVIMIKLA